MDFTSKNLTIPRGRVFFAEFRAGTLFPENYRFVGNCPEFTLSVETQELNHFMSTGGLRTRDGYVGLGGDYGGTLVTDDIDIENLRWWFSGTRTTIAQTAGTDVEYLIEDAMKGGYYQIGRTELLPVGVGNLTEVLVETGTGTALTEFLDYEVDLASGLLWLMPGGTITDETDITVTYSNSAYTFPQIAAGYQGIEGELMFISANPYGPNAKVVLPRCRVTPQGDLSWLTDPETPAWQQISFTLATLQKGNLPPAIITGRPAENSVSNPGTTPPAGGI